VTKGVLGVSSESVEENVVKSSSVDVSVHADEESVVLGDVSSDVSVISVLLGSVVVVVVVVDDGGVTGSLSKSNTWSRTVKEAAE
jgi:hypothetical protein